MRACRPKEKRVPVHSGHGGRWGWKKERERETERERERQIPSPLAPLFICIFPPPGPALCKLGLARSAVCSTWGPHSGPRTFLYSIFQGSSLPCLLATTPFWTPVSYSNYLTSTNMGDLRTRRDLLKSIWNSQGSRWAQGAFAGTMALVSCKVETEEKNLLWVPSVQSLSCIWLFVTPWTAGIPITSSQSLFKFMSIKSVMPSNHLILCCPLLLLPSIFPSIRFFSNESVLRIRWPKFESFSLSLSPSNEYSGNDFL